jgi:hypothetical protein
MRALTNAKTLAYMHFSQATSDGNRQDTLLGVLKLNSADCTDKDKPSRSLSEEEVNKSAASVDPSSAMSTACHGKGPLMFPEKLMLVLDSQEFADAARWSSDGASFVIIPEQFDKVIEKHFPGTKFESFMRKLNRWGFKRVKKRILRFPPNVMAYHHILFREGKPGLLKQIRTGEEKKKHGEFSPQERLSHIIMGSTRAPTYERDEGFVPTRQLFEPPPAILSDDLLLPAVAEELQRLYQTGVSDNISQSGIHTLRNSQAPYSSSAGTYLTAEGITPPQPMLLLEPPPATLRNGLLRSKAESAQRLQHLDALLNPHVAPSSSIGMLQLLQAYPQIRPQLDGFAVGESALNLLALDTSPYNSAVGRDFNHQQHVEQVLANTNERETQWLRKLQESGTVISPGERRAMMLENALGPPAMPFRPLAEDPALNLQQVYQDLSTRDSILESYRLRQLQQQTGIAMPDTEVLRLQQQTGITMPDTEVLRLLRIQQEQPAIFGQSPTDLSRRMLQAQSQVANAAAAPWPSLRLGTGLLSSFTPGAGGLRDEEQHLHDQHRIQHFRARFQEQQHDRQTL